MANSAEVSVNRLEIKNALRNLTDDELFDLRDDFKAKVIGNIHLDAISEEGRTHSSMLLANPVVTLDVIFEILAERNLLTPAEIKNRNLSAPVTMSRIWLDRRTGFF